MYGMYGSRASPNGTSDRIPGGAHGENNGEDGENNGQWGAGMPGYGKVCKGQGWKPEKGDPDVVFAHAEDEEAVLEGGDHVDGEVDEPFPVGHGRVLPRPQPPR